LSVAVHCLVVHFQVVPWRDRQNGAWQGNPLRTKRNHQVHGKVSANGVTNAGDVLGTNPLFEKPAIRFLDVLDLCGVLMFGCTPEAYQQGSNSHRLCDVTNSLSVSVYRPDDGTAGVHVQQHTVLVAVLWYTPQRWEPVGVRLCIGDALGLGTCQMKALHDISLCGQPYIGIQEPASGLVIELGHLFQLNAGHRYSPFSWACDFMPQIQKSGLVTICVRFAGFPLPALR